MGLPNKGPPEFASNAFGPTRWWRLSPLIMAACRAEGRGGAEENPAQFNHERRPGGDSAGHGAGSSQSLRFGSFRFGERQRPASLLVLSATDGRGTFSQLARAGRASRAPSRRTPALLCNHPVWQGAESSFWAESPQPAISAPFAVDGPSGPALGAAQGRREAAAHRHARRRSAARTPLVRAV